MRLRDVGPEELLCHSTSERFVFPVGAPMLLFQPSRQNDGKPGAPEDDCEHRPIGPSDFDPQVPGRVVHV